MKNQNINLIISHNIHLSRQERYDLHEGKVLDIVGVSIPTWQINNIPTEPAKEVFCKYQLKYTGKNEPIKIVPHGFEITLPFRAALGNRNGLDNEEWRKMSYEQLDLWYSKNQPEVNSKILLDYKDGGCQGISYRESSRLNFDDKLVDVRHHILIGELETLLESLS
jgi:hypothetical protein